ncbi:hypothetical protein D9758_001525 [Tetrapyrgos nigripes]|uniref:Fruit-body specific protein a n=1 Tax=Tetrapyrgos nigripes TaxID=182062 RepID=A0A8H5LWX4_9AGAR|nr:hypothetical protein D9758_001525 [Tetrapyrgos nigripes]
MMFSSLRLLAFTVLAVSFVEGASIDLSTRRLAHLAPIFFTPPGLPASDTKVTVIDGASTNQTVDAVVSSDDVTRRSLVRRLPSEYEQIFPGSGTGPSDRDAAIEGTAYLTYTVVDNSTYNVDACLDFCDRVTGCVFANLYYEFNNDLLDYVFSEKSNLKCAVYADIHTAVEKTFFGGQQLEEAPAGLTYIQKSTGWALRTRADIPVQTPDGYDSVLGPTDAANIANGYMGYALLDRYDVQACADLCNARGPDRVGGSCQYFNLWRALVNGVPTTYTCAMYYLVPDPSTATNFGQDNLTVSQSRGYARRNYLVDGGFESYDHCNDGGSFCYTNVTQNWLGTPAGSNDGTVFHFVPYAHSGHSVGLLGSADGSDRLPGTLTPRGTLDTIPGRNYSIQFFLNSDFSGPRLQANAFAEVHWNGQVISTIQPGYSHWTYYQYTVLARGNDVLQFHGARAPAWVFLDDIKVYLVSLC